MVNSFIFLIEKQVPTQVCYLWRVYKCFGDKKKLFNSVLFCVYKTSLSDKSPFVKSFILILFCLMSCGAKEVIL